MENNQELKAYIDNKIKQKQEIAQELSTSEGIIAILKKNKPVRWYNNIYYYIKETILYLSGMACILLLMASFIYASELEDPYSQVFINGSHQKTSQVAGSISVRTPAVSTYHKATFTIPPDEHTPDDVTMEDTHNLLLFGRVVLVLVALLLFYIARLTRKLRKKNVIIEVCYNDNIQNLELYRNLIKEQDKEIEFLKRMI